MIPLVFEALSSSAVSTVDGPACDGENVRNLNSSLGHAVCACNYDSVSRRENHSREETHLKLLFFPLPDGPPRHPIHIAPCPDPHIPLMGIAPGSSHALAPILRSPYGLILVRLFYIAQRDQAVRRAAQQQSRNQGFRRGWREKGGCRRKQGEVGDIVGVGGGVGVRRGLGISGVPGPYQQDRCVLEKGRTRRGCALRRRRARSRR